MERETLGDGADRVLATYVREQRDGRPVADLLAPAPGVAPEEVAAAVLARRRGWLAATEDAALGAALEAAGGLPHRHALMLELPLAAVPARAACPAPPGAVTLPLEAVPEELGAVQVAAYPPGHPDHRPGVTAAQSAQQLRGLIEGAHGHRPMPGSRLALHRREPVGAAVLTWRDVPTHAEPIAWLVELFRRPGTELRGLGAVLLDEAVAAARAAGAPAVGLAVSAGNSARRLYESRGFVAVAEARTVRVPD